MLLRVWKLADPRRQLQHRPMADRAINIFDFFHDLICCLLSSLEHRWNNACTSCNSPRQCEVYRVITGAWETVTVTLGVHWSYFSLHVKVVWCDRSGDQGGVCVWLRDGVEAGGGSSVTGGEEGVGAPSECGCSVLWISWRFIFWMQARLAAVLISPIVL